MSAWKVPLADIQLGPEEIEAVSAVLKSGWLSMGPRTQQFEEEFASFLGIEHAFAVANGTAALHLACEAIGLKEGDEVLCPALTFVATANAILYTGAKPVFIDINGPHDLNLSVEDAAGKVTGKTKAIMVVHYGGYACDMDAIVSLAQRHGLKIIEDCAHAPGTVYYSRQGAQKAGTIGDLGCFSFFSNKNLTTGEGGLVITKDAQLAEKIRISRSHGMTSLTWDRHKGHSFSYDVVARGYNYRIDEMRAALGSVQLARLPEANARRRAITRHYQQQLVDLPQLEMPFASATDASACHILPVLLPPEVDPREFMAHLAKQGIQTSIHYPPIHNFSAYRQLWSAGYDHRLPRTEEVAKREVTLPLFPSLTSEQLELVTEAIKIFLKNK